MCGFIISLSGMSSVSIKMLRVFTVKSFDFASFNSYFALKANRLYMNYKQFE